MSHVRLAASFFSYAILENSEPGATWAGRHSGTTVMGS
jgi:hypothetical protein